jgi:hypothetical protein
MSPVELAILCLGTYRATRLVTDDEFPPIFKARMWVKKKFGEEHWIAELVSCRWCAGVWVSAGMLALRHFAHAIWLPITSVLALGAVAALLYGLERRG